MSRKARSRSSEAHARDAQIPGTMSPHEHQRPPPQPRKRVERSGQLTPSSYLIRRPWLQDIPEAAAKASAPNGEQAGKQPAVCGPATEERIGQSTPPLAIAPVPTRKERRSSLASQMRHCSGVRGAAVALHGQEPKSRDGCFVLRETIRPMGSPPRKAQERSRFVGSVRSGDRCAGGATTNGDQGAPGPASVRRRSRRQNSEPTSRGQDRRSPERSDVPDRMSARRPGSSASHGGDPDATPCERADRHRYRSSGPVEG